MKTKIQENFIAAEKQNTVQSENRLHRTSKIKWTNELVLGLIDEARAAGRKTADEKLRQLRNAGIQYNVKDGSRTVGIMLDVCGFAHLKISARGKFFQIAKKLS